jgi:hypothetical protein
MQAAFVLISSVRRPWFMDRMRERRITHLHPDPIELVYNYFIFQCKTLHFTPLRNSLLQFLQYFICKIYRKSKKWHSFMQKKCTQMQRKHARSNSLKVCENGLLITPVFYKYYVFGHYLSSCLYLKTALFIFQNTTFQRPDFVSVFS